MAEETVYLANKEEQTVQTSNVSGSKKTTVNKEKTNYMTTPAGRLPLCFNRPSC